MPVFHIALTSALNKGEWSALHPNQFTLQGKRYEQKAVWAAQTAWMF